MQKSHYLNSRTGRMFHGTRQQALILQKKKGYKISSKSRSEAFSDGPVGGAV